MPALGLAVTAVIMVLAAGFIGMSAARGGVAQVELHSFRSATPTDREFLNGSDGGRAATISGALHLPTRGLERLPAVIVVHGSGGVSGYVADWAQELNTLGIATFMLDSFTGRGFGEVVFDQGRLGRLAMIVDVYRALDVLSGHPRIDPARIAVLGFSRGGQAALYASVRRFQRMHGSVGTRFAGYAAFYPACNMRFRADEDVADGAILLLHGTADDFNRIGPCLGYVERLKKAGRAARLIAYSGAHHVFDWPMLAKPMILAKAPTTRACRIVEGPDGDLVNSATGQPFTYRDDCVEHGPTLAFDADAHRLAKRDLSEFLTEVLKLR